MNATNAPQQTIDDPDVDAIERLVARFDPTVFDVGRRHVRIRIEAGATRDVVIENGTARLTSSRGSADAVLTADAGTWSQIADDVRGGMAAFRKGRLKIRRDLHLGVGFLAATATPTGPGRLRTRRVGTDAGAISTFDAGAGDPVILVHGLGATKASFLPTVDALTATYRTIALDLPGFGDSDKPLRGAYDAPFFARAIVERIVKQFVPGSDTEWTAAGIDEFMRSYLTRSGRAAFYAAARNIYLEAPRGPDGLWTRLPKLTPEALFIWGRKDNIVPIGFERHVREALPSAVHLELDCGHVPQLERPRETHDAIKRFFAG